MFALHEIVKIIEESGLSAQLDRMKKKIGIALSIGEVMSQQYMRGISLITIQFISIVFQRVQRIFLLYFIMTISRVQFGR